MYKIILNKSVCVDGKWIWIDLKDIGYVDYYIIVVWYVFCGIEIFLYDYYL